ncbi:RTA1-domain-containing protein [Lactarius indigo]|nr:RTA1-domain-containing protein [Lactarius indigo]
MSRQSGCASCSSRSSLYQPAVRSRLWWLFPTAVLSGITEIIGWSGRLWSSLNPVLRTPFLMQYDIVALIVQSVGGGIASDTQLDLGGHIALGGIVLQLVALLFFTFVAGEFLLRFAYDRPIRHSHVNVDNVRGPVDRNIGLTITGLSTMTIAFLIRSVYRTIELSGGWSGKIISTQWLFNAFDGAMIVLATFTLNFLHPGVLLRGYDRVRVGPSTEKTIGSANSQSV